MSKKRVSPPRYDVRLWPSSLALGLLWALVLVMALLSAYLWLVVEDDWWKLALTTAVAVGLPLWIAVMHGRVRIDDTYLTLALIPVGRIRIPLTDIESLTCTETHFIDFRGIGLRRGTVEGYSVLGLVMRHGPALLITTPREGRYKRYVVATPDPDGLISALNRPR